MIDRQIGILLDAVVEIVNNDAPWIRKRDLIRKVLEGDESYQVAFEEFISWFEPAERS